MLPRIFIGIIHDISIKSVPLYSDWFLSDGLNTIYFHDLRSVDYSFFKLIYLENSLSLSLLLMA